MKEDLCTHRGTNEWMFPSITCLTVELHGTVNCIISIKKDIARPDMSDVACYVHNTKCKLKGNRI